jgi:hypothetical protein
MAAIEYGSYYWCVVLAAKDNEQPESVHLHADDMSIDDAGALVFHSAGRRPAGTEPLQQDSDSHGDTSSPQDREKTAERDGQRNGNKGKQNMVYMAFAPGTWRIVYAAKLQDGAPASVEHWKTFSEEKGAAGAAKEPAGVTSFPSTAQSVPVRA